MGKLNRRKKYCECIDNCGTEIPLHCHFATGHHLRGATPHNKGKKREEYLSPEAISSIIASATGKTRREESNVQTSVSLLKFYDAKGRKREYWQAKLTELMKSRLVNFWISRINPLITGSGYIPDPIAYQQQSG